MCLARTFVLSLIAPHFSIHLLYNLALKIRHRLHAKRLDYLVV